ncbi:histidine triad (HIT) protein [Desulfurococcaceae archaeon AG1]|nr:histidine triad (HIT) protein [Desulfurococcaceae archaeon AG1]
MDMLRILWAPWRMSYIKNADRMHGCFLCESIGKRDEDTYIVYRSEKVFVILNSYPYNTGHIMIAPYRHIAELESLDDKETIDLINTMKKSLRVLRDVYSPQGFNIGINIGRVAGAGLESHLHVHIVPRWGGDTNFMPIIGGDKVLPEDLTTTWRKIRDAFKKS